MQTKKGLSALNHWDYRQIHSYVMGLQRYQHFQRPLTPLKSTCFMAHTSEKNISLVYTWLQASTLQEPNKYKEFWETALKITFTKDQWLQACVFAHKCSISTRLQETSFSKTSSLNELVQPIKIHKWFPSVPDLCWCCNQEKGTLQHIWWGCSQIQPFWQQVCNITKLITGTKSC